MTLSGGWKTKSFKFAATGLVLIMLAAGMLPQITRAQVGGIVSDVPLEAQIPINNAKEEVKLSFVGSVFTYLVNLMTFAADYGAYQAAVLIASGGPAEEPLFEGSPTTVFFKDWGAAVAGEALGSLQQDLADSNGLVGSVFSKFNLCQPRLEVTLAIQLGIEGVFRKPVPQCDFLKVRDNWEGFIADIDDSLSPEEKHKIVMSQLANAFDPQVNEFSVGLELQSSIFRKVLDDSAIKATENVNNNGFKPVVDFITGNVETPASIINNDFLAAKYKKESVGDQILAATLMNTDALLQVGIHAGSVFTNTLLSGLSKKVAEGLFDFAPSDSDPFAGFENIATSNANTARNQFRSLLTFTPLEITNYSILADFATCPSGIPRGLYNCVADNSFISAVGRADAGTPLTLEQAVDEGLVNSSWPLIKSTDLSRDQDQYCYTYGFCHSNLVKLRKARIIPIGWELAAESQYNTSSTGVALQEVMDGFNNCNDAGQADSNHPWCKLIDPNWVLKYPETQCKAQVYGQLLQTPAADERQQECVDMPSCISENADGTCTGGYGYCVKEENTWLFRGESCPAQFASCLTFEGEDKTVSYLENTVDFSNCSEDNAGCLWYDTEKADPEGDNTFDWQPVDDIAAADADPEAFESRIYLTNAAEDCDSQDGGCRQLFERDQDVSLNIVNNPSFEIDNNNDSHPDAWLFRAPSVVYDTASAFSHSGADSVLPGATSAVYQPGIAFSQGRFYTMSVYARQVAAGGVASFNAQLLFATDTVGTDVNLVGTSMIAGATATCVVANSGSAQIGDGLADVVSMRGQPTGIEHERFTCTFTSPTVSDSAALISAILDISGNVYVDDIQVEQGELASTYHSGYSVQPSTLTVKVPPAYLGCTGEATDPEECNNYAQVCSENDVGCTAYSPGNGDPTITGIASELDYCPSTCVGYDTFKQEPTLYEPQGDFPVYFIPETGQTCSEEEVGCDEFTNLTNEAKEYYTYLRACLTPAQANANTGNDRGETFYTWEGSDLAGYQLKTWGLLESNMGPSTYTYLGGGEDRTPDLAPCSNWEATQSGIRCLDNVDTDGDTKMDWDTVECNEHDDIFTNPDCREFYDTEGGIHYREWSKTVTVNDACTTYRKTEITGADLAIQELNCEGSGGFFNAASGSCQYYGYAPESLGCSASANGCRSYTGGRSRNSRVVLSDLLENGSLTNWDTQSAADVTLSNESLATGGHSISATNNFSTFVFDNGSTCANGDCLGTAQSLGGTCTVGSGQRYCGTLENELFTGKTYTLSFWAKGEGNLEAGFDLSAGNNRNPEVSFGTVTLSNGWQEYSLGPLDMNAEAYPKFGIGSTLVFAPGNQAYVDNITLREGEDNITLIKNSWNTPIECDQTPVGTSSPQYYLGCQDYTTQTGATAYLKSFSSLCSSDKVGCEDFFMTQESDSPYAEVHNAVCSVPSGLPVQSATSCYYAVTGTGAMDPTSQYLCTIGVGQTSCTFDLDWNVGANNLPAHLSYASSTVVVPADSDAFLVVNDSVTCSSTVAGCQELGDITWNQDRNSTSGAESVYKMNDPDTYDDILCTADELFCSEWDTDTEGTFFFKDPLDQTCEYRTGVTVNGGLYDGWFREGLDEFCYGTCDDGVTACATNAQCGTGTCNTTDPSYLINGNYSGVWKNGDPVYGGWTGTCDAQYSTCSEFQDPLDYPSNASYVEAGGTSYFYLNNESLSERSLPDSQKCNGQSSLKEGCVLFNDTTNPSKDFNSSATEVSSSHADVFFGQNEFSLVDPIDCSDDSEATSLTTPDGTRVDLCAQRCVYDIGQVKDISDPTIRNLRMPVSPAAGDPEDIYIIGSSCYLPTDCPPIKSESGDDVQAFACDVEVGVSRGGGIFGGLITQTAPVPRLENDTNEILKVDRDRQCSEWLSCAEDQAVWDERTSSWRTVCSDIELCTEYSSLGGTAQCSKWKTDEPEVVLTEDQYINRDISWYGQEYSGYAIPDLYPVEALDQANIAPPPGTCDLSQELENNPLIIEQYDTYHGQPCDPTLPGNGITECGGGFYYSNCVSEEVEPDYRLALIAGTCEGGYMSECSVGYCENTGASCASTNDCGASGGSCVVGECQTQGGACTNDTDCTSFGQICSGGTCISSNGLVTIENYNDPNVADCSAGQVLATNAAFKVGSCIRDQCLLTPDGETFDVASSEGTQCRAYPESNSPFPEDMVESWLDTGTQTPNRTGSGETWDDVPYDVVSGFENANFCAPGEDCMCTYKKVTYGPAGEVRYFNPEREISGNNICLTGRTNESCSVDNDCDVLDAVGGVSVEGTCMAAADGLCSSGRLNQLCATDSDCDVVSGATVTTQGVCALPTREDTLLGLEGYCLEKDSGLNIQGDQNKKACITWLPVDQLAGSTDLFAKFSEAGYFNDTFACSYTAPFVNLMMSDHPEPFTDADAGEIACANMGTNAVGDQDVNLQANLETCANNVTCPDGYWAIMSMAQFQDGGYASMGAACAENTGDNDCPYVCIPKEATLTDSEGNVNSCDYDDPSEYVDSLMEYEGTEFNWTSGPWDDDVKVLSANVAGGNKALDVSNDTILYQRFDYMVDALAACSLKGVPYSSVDDEGVLNIDATADDGNPEKGSYRTLIMNAEFYPACQEVIQVVDSSTFTGYAWTDRLLGPVTKNTYTIDSVQPGIDFKYGTTPGPYGFTSVDPGLASTDYHWPLVDATCQATADDSLHQPQSISPFTSCTDPQQPYEEGLDGTTATPGDPDPSADVILRSNPASAFPTGTMARSFIGFSLTNNLGSPINDWAVNLEESPFEPMSQIFARPDIGDNSEGEPYAFIWNAEDALWPNIDRWYEKGDDYSVLAEDYDVRGDEGSPPQVFAVTTDCEGTVCEEGPDGSLTVNDQTSGNVEGIDNVRAYLKFYAAADTNQLPIRRVIIDWGDDLTGTNDIQGSPGDDNFYKNHRGLEPGKDTSWCDSNDEWGMTAESCDPNYFSYSHVYTCESSILVDGQQCVYDASGKLTNSPCYESPTGADSDRVCVFQPKVHVRDNWGWCSGTCGDSALGINDDGTDGCFEGGVDTLSNPDDIESECSYVTYPNSGFPQIDPWVYYNGTIKVDNP